MALIICPECSKEISDAAQSCPKCGFVLNESVRSNAVRTELSEAKRSRTLGIVMIVAGIGCIIVGIPLIAAIIGILPIIGGLAFIGFGKGMITGEQEGACPYCGNKVSVEAKDVTHKCRHCKKISNKRDNFLETIE